MADALTNTVMGDGWSAQGGCMLTLVSTMYIEVWFSFKGIILRKYQSACNQGYHTT